MNFHRLTTRLEFGGVPIYVPDDPYRIYERLAIVYLKGRDVDTTLTSVTHNFIYQYNKLFSTANFRDGYIGSVPHLGSPLSFLKWVHQEIPSQFWKFNLYIDKNYKTLLRSANSSDTMSVWIDMRGIKNKLKCVATTENVLRDLSNGATYLPDYDTICNEVSSWKKEYTYNFGSLKEPIVRWRG